MEIPDIFSELCIEDVCYNEPLSHHSTWNIGGPADIFIEPDSIEQIRRILIIANLKKIPLVVIGNGSNILFNDNGVRGIVLKLGGKFSCYSITGTSVTTQAGIYLPDLVQILADAGLSGLEHAAGIPASLGGLVYMNGGSQNKAIGDIVNRVWVLDNSGNYFRMSREECNFSYRKSAFQEKNLIICAVEINLRERNPDLIQKEMAEILSLRAQKIPLDLPSCGSVFLSSPSSKITNTVPGKLIEEAGLKGYRIGGAEISKKHANFIVNVGNATAEDVIQLVRYIKERISEIYSLSLKCEIKYVDENGIIKNLDAMKY